MTVPARPARGRVLGLDVGERRIGVAISDPEQRLAVPLRTLERDRRGGEIEALSALTALEEVTAVVIGMPLSLSGERGAQAMATEAFADQLRQHLAVPVLFWDERLSTRQALASAGPRRAAHRRRQRAPQPKVDSDMAAATIVLQAFLDSMGRPGHEA